MTIVVDQLAAWIADDRLPLLPKDGGFARLRAEGTYLREVHYAHAATDAAPGHAALYTGQPPRLSGVAANERIDPASGKHFAYLRDEETHPIDFGGIHTNEVSSSAERLRAPTLADDLRKAAPDAFIVSVSLKDRASIPGGGHHPSAALWFDPKLNAFVTSTAFAKELPEWSRTAALDWRPSERSPVWKMVDEAWVKEHAATGDGQDGEGAWPGMTSTFPHDLTVAKTPSHAFRASPLADRAVLTIADAAIDADAFGRTPTLLAISLSANDYIGHVYGPDSWEAWDNLRQLDAGLAGLFHHLDEKLGKDGYAVVLSADHGIGPLPELPVAKRKWCQAQGEDHWDRPCELGHRLSSGELETHLQKSAERAMGKGGWIAGVSDPYVVFSPSAKQLPPADRRKLVADAVATLKKEPGVIDVLDTASLPASCPPLSDETIPALVCRSYADEVGDLYLVLAPGTFIDTEYVPGKGVNHGTPWLYERAVPLLARAPGKIAAAKLEMSPRSFATFRKTAGALLGLATPPDLAGDDLTRP